MSDCNIDARSETAHLIQRTNESLQQSGSAGGGARSAFASFTTVASRPGLLELFIMYNKLFCKILDSSIWLESMETRIVWITLLAAMDEDGFAHFSALENLAARARVPLKETKKAVDCLLKPDRNSSNPANDGRRIERVPGGFIILNAAEHRKRFNREIEREQTRVRVRRHRERKTEPSVTEALQSVTPAFASESAFALEEGEVQEGKKKNYCTQKEAEDFCQSLGLPRSDGDAMFLHWEEKGWAKVKDWKLTIKKWKSFGYLPSQRQQKRNGMDAMKQRVWKEV